PRPPLSRAGRRLLVAGCSSWDGGLIATGLYRGQVGGGLVYVVALVVPGGDGWPPARRHRQPSPGWAGARPSHAALGGTSSKRPSPDNEENVMNYHGLVKRLDLPAVWIPPRSWNTTTSVPGRSAAPTRRRCAGHQCQHRAYPADPRRQLADR